METYFSKFRAGIIGVEASFLTIDGKRQDLLYADWAASGRNYAPIELKIQENIMPLISNTEGEANLTRWATSYAYRTAREMVKKHVNACPDDIVVTACAGSTRMIIRFQQILCFYANIPTERKKKAVVFVTHMEHYSNETSWIEAGATVVPINANEKGLVCLEHLETLLTRYKEYPVKIASVSACSNITGIVSPYHEIAQIMHDAGGYCFVDFAYSAPYVTINMHPEKKNAHLDAVFFSPHKFLGGPGTASVLVFNQKVYQLCDEQRNKEAQSQSCEQIERMEDDGSPAILQTIKTAMCISLKEEMGPKNILAWEHQLIKVLWKRLKGISNLHVLAPNNPDRLGVISFFIEGLDTYWAVRLLNDKFGIQCKAGKSVPNTYGYDLVREQLDKKESSFSNTLYWIRVSMHPTMTMSEIKYIGDSIAELTEKHKQWQSVYSSMPCENFSIDVKRRINATLRNEFVGANQSTLKPVK